jgi:hypothetical protein
VAALTSVMDYIDADLTHSIHTSARKSFRGCRLRWHWLFQEFFYPRETAKPLEFGVAFHKAMETLYNPVLWTKPRDMVLEMAIQAFRNTCKEQLDSYRELVGEPDQEKLDDYNERKELGEGMLRYFAEWSEPKDQERYRPVKVEIKFEVPITNPDTGEQLWCKCRICWGRYLAQVKPEGQSTSEQAQYWNEDLYKYWKGLPVTYGGRIDAIFEDINTGQYYIVDWKTAATLAEEQQRMMFLDLDDQIGSYVWALNLCGIRAVGFLYTEIKKAYPVPPEMLSRRYKGRLFSTNKDQPTSYEIFLKTVEENDPEGLAVGAYEEYLERLQEEPQRFTARYTKHRNVKELNVIAKDIYEEACDIVDPNLRIYPNAGRFNCQTCAFNQPCLERRTGGDVTYTLTSLFDKRKYHYWEDKKPSTETKGGE